MRQVKFIIVQVTNKRLNHIFFVQKNCQNGGIESTQLWPQQKVFLYLYETDYRYLYHTGD